MKPFTALAPTQSVTAGTTAAFFTYPRNCSSLMVDNTNGATFVDVVAYDTAAGAQVATAAATPVAAGTVQVVGSPPSCNAVSYATTSGTATVRITPGEGN